ncbi:hypothetical protein C0989_002689 [Termitomyces sp. Mn162]|nr:hypothetical protein C0989_002689 [Termitomyces sp. Mn162]
MSQATRTSSRPPLSSPNTGRTLKHMQLIPTHSNLKTLLAADPGLIRSLPEVHQWLESNGWILAAESYDCLKLISILATAALYSKPSKLKSTTLAVTFLLKADVMDQVSNVLAEAITSKALGRLSGLVEKLGSMAKFLTANDTQRVKSTLALKSMSETLAGVSSSLDAMAFKLANTPQQSSLPIIWASIAKASVISLTPPAQVV